MGAPPERPTQRELDLQYYRANGFPVNGDPFCGNCGNYRSQHVDSKARGFRCLFSPTTFVLKKYGPSSPPPPNAVGL